jgi:hypothetical protein
MVGEGDEIQEFRRHAELLHRKSSDMRSFTSLRRIAPDSATPELL